MVADDVLQATLTALTRDLMLIPSTAARADEVRRCFELVRNHLDELQAIRVRDFEHHGHQSMVFTPDACDQPEVLLCGHLDVIEHPERDCYHSRLQDGRIYGPGAGDMKGQDAILIELFRNLHTHYPGISVGLALTSDEEIGGADGMRYLCDDVGLRCGTAIIPDGGSISEITIEEKGVIHGTIRCTGKSAHGARPWLGRNAVEQLTAGLFRLQQHFQQYWPARLVGQEDHWFPTCAVTVIRTPNTTPNRIPSMAEAIVDVRFPPPHCIASIREEICRTLGDGFDFAPLMMAEPTHLQPDEVFRRITSELTECDVRLVRASGASDARFLCKYGISVNLSRPLVGNLHDVDEWIDVDSMATYYRICEKFIIEKLVT